MFNPKVSIIIPVYNGSNYLREAINSALKQTYQNIEVIVVNDGSKDNSETEKIALSYGDKIRYFLKENGGVATALNFGIERMQGEYFSWLSHDDMYTPFKIEKQVSALLENYDPSAIAFCDYYSIDIHGYIIKESKISKKAALSMKCFLATDVQTGIHGCSLLIPKRVFDQYGFFDPALKCTQDYEMWFRFAEKISFVHVEEMMVISRQHPEQDSKNKLDICLTEADALHSRVISSLTEKEIYDFSGESINHFIEVYDVYKKAGYKKIAASLLKLICTYANLPNDLKKTAGLLKSDVLQSGKNEDVLHLLVTKIQPLLRSKTSMPKLVFYNNVWWRGGVERVLTEIMKCLKDKYCVVLITLDIEKDAIIPFDPRVLHIRIGDSENYVNRLIDLTILLDADVFIGNPNFSIGFLDIYSALNVIGIKTIACNHAYFFLPFWDKCLNQVFKYRINAFKNASVVTWLTNFSNNIYGLSNDNGVCMPNPMSYDSCPMQNESKEKVVLCVGRFYDSIKRIDRMLNVFHKVLLFHPDAKLYLVGGYDLDMRIPSNSPETIGEIIKKLGLNSSQLIFLGEKENVEEYYKKASLLVLTSDNEGFAVVLTEAGAYGLPSVIFDIPGLEDIITDGENGFIVAQDDIDGMAEKISLLLNDKSLCEKMGKNAQILVERFNRARICERWTRLVDIVLNSDSQEDINKRLKQNFFEPIKDQYVFMSRMIAEYDKIIINMLNSKDERSNSSTKILPDMLNSGSSSMEQGVLISRIKPLYWIKKVIKSLFKDGFFITFKKIIMKFKGKFNF